MTKNAVPKIFITPGEPAGIGPDITIQTLQREWPAELIVIADPDLLLARAQQLGLPLSLSSFEPHQPATLHQPCHAKIIPIKLKAACTPGKLNPDNASYVIKTLETATDYCSQKIGDALVTGPVQKSILNDAGIPFIGHTEFLAERLNSPQPIMLFVTPQTKVALATTHLPLSQIPSAITADLLINLIRTLHHELQIKFKLPQPKILVTGLNPHAGEQGHLGHEEIDVIEPALDRLRQENIHITGPLPADTIFTEKYLKTADLILAMYHDQALPVVKYMSFGHAVNVTLGLPIIRTSVDHGTALDIAGTGRADAGSLEAALELAIRLAS